MMQFNQVLSLVIKAINIDRSYFLEFWLFLMSHPEYDLSVKFLKRHKGYGRGKYYSFRNLPIQIFFEILMKRSIFGRWS